MLRQFLLRYVYRVDTEILPLVEVLNKKGFKTIQSCAGHVDHGSPMPYVYIDGGPENEKFSQMKALIDEFNDKSQEGELFGPAVREFDDGVFSLYFGKNISDSWRDLVADRISIKESLDGLLRNLSAEEQRLRRENLNKCRAVVSNFMDFLEGKYK